MKPSCDNQLSKFKVTKRKTAKIRVRSIFSYKESMKIHTLYRDCI